MAKNVEHAQRVTKTQLDKFEGNRGIYFAVYILNPRFDYIIENINFQSREKWRGQERIAIVDAVLEMERQIREDMVRIPYLDLPMNILGKATVEGERLKICPGVGLTRDPCRILLSGEEKKDYQKFKKNWAKLKDKSPEWRNFALSIYVNSLTLLDVEHENLITMDRPRRATGRVKKMMQKAGAKEDVNYLKPLEVKELFHGGNQGINYEYLLRSKPKGARISYPVPPPLVARSLPNLGVRDWPPIMNLTRVGAVAAKARVDEERMTILNEKASIVIW